MSGVFIVQYSTQKRKKKQQQQQQLTDELPPEPVTSITSLEGEHQETTIVGPSRLSRDVEMMSFHQSGAILQELDEDDLDIVDIESMERMSLHSNRSGSSHHGSSRNSLTLTEIEVEEYRQFRASLDVRKSMNLERSEGVQLLPTSGAVAAIPAATATVST